MTQNEVFGGPTNYQGSRPQPQDAGVPQERGFTWSPGFLQGRLISPGTPRQLGVFGLFPPPPSQNQVVQLSGQPLTAKNAGPELLWVAFDELCAIDASRSDYLALAEDHGTWVIDGVPSPAVESPRATAVAWQRFSEVVEVLFERDVTLFVVGNGLVGWKSEAADHSAALPGVTDRLAGRLALLPLIESEDDLPDAESAGC